jgi:hypothetical protein
MYQPVGIMAGTSSLDVAPADHLDPDLFDGDRMKTFVRTRLLGTIGGFLGSKYQGSPQWLRAWLAGSGASYRWYASHGDLDILLGVDFVGFRQANPDYSRLGDSEIAHHLNEEMRQELWPTTKTWMDKYETTWFVNPKSWDISVINPYAAYDLVQDDWTVRPSQRPPNISDEWKTHAALYGRRAETAISRYGQTLQEMQGAQNPAHRRDAELRFHMAVEQSVALFDTVHKGRKNAFTTVGQGYDDFSNYLWQSGKASGWIQALRDIKDYHQAATASHHARTYGMELPDTDTLIRRAATRRI